MQKTSALYGWMGGWMDVEAGLRIAYSNQKFAMGCCEKIKQTKHLHLYFSRLSQEYACAIIFLCYNSIFHYGVINIYCLYGLIRSMTLEWNKYVFVNLSWKEKIVRFCDTFYVNSCFCAFCWVDICVMCIIYTHTLISTHN